MSLTRLLIMVKRRWLFIHFLLFFVGNTFLNGKALKNTVNVYFFLIDYYLVFWFSSHSIYCKLTDEHCSIFSMPQSRSAAAAASRDRSSRGGCAALAGCSCCAGAAHYYIKKLYTLQYNSKILLNFI